MRNLLKPIVRIALIASLLGNSSPGLEAAFLSVPFTQSQISFRVNQEKMRLETEAMILQMVASRPLLENLQSFPFLSRLLVFFKGPSFSPQILGPEEQARVYRAERVFARHLPSQDGIFAAAVLSAVTVLLSYFFGFGGVENPLVQIACGNYMMFGAKPLGEMIALMRGPSKDLFDRGVLSLGGYFQYQETLNVPVESQVPGFEMKDAVTVWKYKGVKDAVMKRDDPVGLLFDPLQKMAEAHKDMLPSSVEIHSRFATTGDKGSTLNELAEAAQPGIAPAHWELRWESDPILGMTSKYVWVENHYQFNGDLYKSLLVQLKKLIEVGIRDPQVQQRREALYAELEALPVEEIIGNAAAFDQAKLLFSELIQNVEPTGNEEARNRMQRWLGLQGLRIPPGDAPLLALYQDMFYTERMWYPSIRYALFAHVAAPNDALDLNPPLQKMKQWQVFFEHAFHNFLKEYPGMTWDTPEQMGTEDEAIQAARRLAHQANMFHKYLRELILDTSMTERPRFFGQIKNRVDDAVLNDLRDTLGKELDPFLKTATTAFWRNTMTYMSIREIKPRFKGTVGGTNLSTLNPPGSRVMGVTTIDGQGIVFVVSKDGSVGSVTSDRRIQQQLPEDVAFDAIMGDDTGNESLAHGMSADGKVLITLYRGPDSIPVSEEELRKTRLRPLRQTEDSEVLTNGNGHGLPELGRVETGIRAASMQLGVVRENWLNVEQASAAGYPEGKGPPNLQPATELIRVTIQNRIYEFIRKQIGVNERSLSRDLEERIWQKAEQLSRDVWERNISELDVRKESAKVAQRIEQELLASSKLRVKASQLPGIFGEIADLANAALGASPREQISYLKQIAVIVFSAIKMRLAGGRLEEQAYDMVLVGTENSRLAVEKFAEYILGPMLGIRAKVISGNEFLEKADKYRNDAPGFMRHFQISSLRTPVLLVSDSAETFEAGVDSAWAVATLSEVFSLTGSRDNRLVDRVRRMRAFTTHNPGSKVRDGVKPYVAMLQTFNELGLFWAENVMTRFKTGGSRWDKRPFFQTPFTLEDIQILKRSNDRFVKDIAPVILGYHPSGIEMGGAGDAREKLESLGKHTGARQLEMVRWWFLEKVELLLAPLIGWGINAGLVELGILIPSVMTTLFSYGLGFALSLSLLFGMRVFRTWMGWPTPKIWAGFAPPAFVFADKYRYVYHFWTLYMRNGVGKAFGINSANFYGSSINDLIDDYKGNANRRAVVLMGRPGTYHRALNSDDQSVETAGRQLKSILNIPFRWLEKFGVRPVGPEVDMIGHYTPDDTDWWKMSRDRDTDFSTNNRLWIPPGKQIADMPDHLIHYYEDNYGGFGRLLGGIRAMGTHINIVSNHYPKFPALEFPGGYFVKSTAGPRPGDTVLESVQRRPMKLVRIAEETPAPSSNPIVINPHRIDTNWLSDFPSRRSGALHSFTPPSRPPTRHPRSARSQLSRSETVEPVLRQRPAEPVTAEPVAVEVPVVDREKAVAVPQSVTLRGLMTAEEMDDLLAEASSGDEIERSGTTLLLKNKEVRENSNLRWGPIVVHPQNAHLWDTKDLNIPTEMHEVLTQIFQNALEDSTLNKPFVLYVHQVAGRAATSQHNPAQSKLAGTVTMDADLMEDIVKNVEYAAPAAMLELYEEVYELAHPNTEGLSRSDYEARMLQAKVKVFLSLRDEVQLGIIQYLRAHRLFDPKDVDLALVYEKAIHDKQAYDSEMANTQNPSLVSSLEHRLEMTLLGYVHKAIEYEKESPKQIPTEGPFSQTQAPAAERRGRLLTWPITRIAGLLIFSLLFAQPNTRPQGASIGSDILLEQGPVPAVLPALPAIPPSIPMGPVPDSVPSRLLSISPRLGVTDLYEFADQLREIEELKEVLSKPGWEDRLWREVVGPQSNSGRPDKLTTKDKFDLTPLLKGIKNTPQRKNSKTAVAQNVLKAGLVIVMSLSGVVAAVAAPLSSSHLSRATDIVLQKGIPLPEVVQSGQTLSQIARDAHLPLSKLLEWNPVYLMDPDTIIAGKDVVNFAPSSTLFPDLPALPSITGPVDIPSSLTHFSNWESVQMMLHQLLPYAAWFAIAAGAVMLLIWTFRQISSSQGRAGRQLKWAVVTAQILLQLVMPLKSMAAPIGPAGLWGSARVEQRQSRPLDLVFPQTEPQPDPVPAPPEAVQSPEQTPEEKRPAGPISPTEAAVKAVAAKLEKPARPKSSVEAIEEARERAVMAHLQVARNRMILKGLKEGLDTKNSFNPLKDFKPTAAVEELIANYEMSFLARKLNSKSFVSFLKYGVLTKSARSLVKAFFKPLTGSVHWLALVTEEDKVKKATVQILEDAADQHALQEMVRIQDEADSTRQRYVQAQSDEKATREAWKTLHDANQNQSDEVSHAREIEAYQKWQETVSVSEVAEIEMKAAALVQQALTEYLLTPKGSLSPQGARLSSRLRGAHQKISEIRVQLVERADLDDQLETALGQKPAMLTWESLVVSKQSLTEIVAQTEAGILLGQAGELARQELELVETVNTAPAENPTERLQDLFAVAQVDAARQDVQAAAVQQASAGGIPIAEVKPVPVEKPVSVMTKDILQQKIVSQFLESNRLLFDDPKELLGLSHAINLYPAGNTAEEQAQAFISNLSLAGTLVQAQAKTQGLWMAPSYAVGQAVKSYAKADSPWMVKVAQIRSLVTDKQMPVADALQSVLAAAAAPARPARVTPPAKPVAQSPAKLKPASPSELSPSEKERRRRKLESLPRFPGRNNSAATQPGTSVETPKTITLRGKTFQVFPRSNGKPGGTNMFLIVGLLGVSAPAVAIPAWLGWIGLVTLMVGLIQLTRSAWAVFKSVMGWNSLSAARFMGRSA